MTTSTKRTFTMGEVREALAAFEAHPILQYIAPRTYAALDEAVREAKAEPGPAFDSEWTRRWWERKRAEWAARSALVIAARADRCPTADKVTR